MATLGQTTKRRIETGSRGGGGFVPGASRPGMGATAAGFGNVTGGAGGYGVMGPPRPSSTGKIRPNSAGVKSAWDLAPENSRGASRARAPSPSATAKRYSATAGNPSLQTRGAGAARPESPRGARPQSPRRADTVGANRAPAPSPTTRYPVGGGLDASQASMGKSFGGRDSFSDQLFSGSRASASAAKYKRPASAHGSRGKPAASKPVSVGLADAGGSPAEENGGVRREHVAKLESEMREVLKAHRTVYQGEKELLQKIFRRVDDGNQAVDLDEFLELWDRLGVQMTEAEGIAVFKKHGCSERRPMAYDKFVEAFTARPSRKLGQEMIRKGAFVAGQKANFSGKILYPQCRKGVFAPTDWDPSLARRSAELPEASLELEFVYGYNGLHNTAPNLFYTGTGEVVYYTAAIGIVYDKETNTQRFFLGHSDDIKSLGLCRAEVALPDGSLYPPRTLVASGQVTPVGGHPYVCIWDTRRPGNKPLQTLPFDPSARGILAVAFSPDGRTLVTVSSDNQHTAPLVNPLRCTGRCGIPSHPQCAS
ncbi:hypothetical protein CYMTET_15224 [Cymbomonas tetramitiformis]|uniref:EF-hand domain-containing protein n=1 Tax=Cymbomonas tetramitiformis TaxID=36881 RepID=A0AAE0GEF1_9CHLO|nr:hypothetical protein CYMTET_15224 [Cymbomonas tetramitiformis]